jgi:energy-converting hydrogenase Eha subunit F
MFGTPLAPGDVGIVEVDRDGTCSRRQYGQLQFQRRHLNDADAYLTEWIDYHLVAMGIDAFS